MKDMIKVIVTAVVLVAVTSLGIYAVRNYERLPIVQLDAATHECVDVIQSSNDFSCDEMPTRYMVEYIAPVKAEAPKVLKATKAEAPKMLKS